MTYRLLFREDAWEEWGKPGSTVRKQFKRKLAERLELPHVPSARLHGSESRYKIRLRSSGYRLVHEVRDSELVVSVIAFAKRERGAVYAKAAKR